jgi:hypothetical protein
MVSAAETLAEARMQRRMAGLQKLRDNLPLYAAETLKIKDKDGLLRPFSFNRAQLYLHDKIEAQRQRTGMVRALVGKGRQGGVSTYVGARFFHRTTMHKGVECFILTHEQDATDNLFEMVERFHEHSPFKPSTSKDNAKELVFDKLDSGYSVGTAGTKARGRSKTIQLLHGSECAYWANAADHFAGVVQAVPGRPGTEIILESTAAGPWGEFYERWQQAEAQIGDYEAIFVPWFWTEDYTRDVPEGFSLDDEERECQRLFGLTDGQIVWRRAKIAELKDPQLFRQEYPSTAVDMFSATGRSSYIPPELVIAARKASLEGVGPLVVGVDPARFGDDRFSVAWRRGRRVHKIESRSKIGTTEALAWLRDIIDQDKPAKMFLDAGGGGDRLYDILESWGKPYSDVVSLVNFGSAPQTETLILDDGTKRAGPANRRAEMWMRSKEWLEQTGGAQVPDLDTLQADASAPGYTYRTTDQRLILESKEAIRARGVRSPDEWDAIALSFAEPVRDRPQRDRSARTEMQEISSSPGQSWMGA